MQIESEIPIQKVVTHVEYNLYKTKTELKKSGGPLSLSALRWIEKFENDRENVRYNRQEKFIASIERQVAEMFVKKRITPFGLTNLGGKVVSVKYIACGIAAKKLGAHLKDKIHSVKDLFKYRKELRYVLNSIQELQKKYANGRYIGFELDKCDEYGNDMFNINRMVQNVAHKSKKKLQK